MAIQRQEAPDQASPRRLTRLLVTLLAGLFMGNVDNAIVNVAIPSIRKGFSAPAGLMELVVSGYTLAYAMLLITGARLGSIRGYRRTFILGLAVFTGASLACGLAPSALMLVFFRLIQGAGAAFMIPQVLSGIQASFTGRERARALGLYSATLSGGAVAGQILGGLIVSANILQTGWRAAFLVNVPIGVALLGVCARASIPEAKAVSRRFDLAGVALLSMAVLAAILPLELGRDLGWPVWTWIMLAASVPATTLFIRRENALESGGGHPLISLRAVGRPAVAWGLIGQGLAMMTYFAMLFILSMFFQQGLGRSALYSGLSFVSWVATFGIAGYLVQKLPPRITGQAAPFGYLLLASAYAGLSAGLFCGIDGGPVLVALFGLCGFGLGIGFGSLMARLTAAVAVQYAPDLSGIVTTSTQTAAVTGVAVFGTLYLGLLGGNALPAQATGVHLLRSLGTTTSVMAVVALAASFAVHRSVRSPVS